MPKRFSILVLSSLFTIAVISTSLVYANHLDDDISGLREENASHQSAVDELEVEADSYQSAINRLQDRINGVQAQIVANQNKHAQLQRDIIAAEEELARQKDVLGQNIKTMYLESQISTLEILAASKSLGEFIDREQYRNAVQDKITATVDKIAQLKQELVVQKNTVERLIAEQTQLQNNLSADRNEQSQLLAYTEGQQAGYTQKIKSNNAKIAELKRQQALENIRRFGGSGGRLGGGGYPWGYAKCIHTGNVEGWCSNYDWAVGGSIYNWQTGGYGFRNCTDWVSFRIRSSGGYVPSGMGNANQWDNRAPGKGYVVSSTPKVGAVAVSNFGFYGHVMYVEAVNEDGSILVSDYNRAGTGKYDANVISPAGLLFVYF
ncbi:MAG: CHAP domain-containing protein [Candidatus Saccharimonadales bacterium]